MPLLDTNKFVKTILDLNKYIGIKQNRLLRNPACTITGFVRGITKSYKVLYLFSKNKTSYKVLYFF